MPDEAVVATLSIQEFVFSRHRFCRRVGGSEKWGIVSDGANMNGYSLSDVFEGILFLNRSSADLLAIWVVFRRAG